MPAAFAIMHISREDSAIGSVTPRVPTPDTIKVPLVEQCALVLSKVRCRLTTFNLLRPRFDLRDGNPVRKSRPEEDTEFTG